MEKEKLVETNQLSEKQKLLLYFFTYSFLGWILETVFCILTLGVFNKRGFLYGPVCPIYGFGAIILIESLKKIKTNTVGKFFISMIAFTTFEYVVSVVLESLFGLRENFLHILEEKFDEFIHGGLTLTNEFLLPDILKNGINEGLFQIQSKVSESRWIGMTYKEDLESVKNHINSLIERGDYPDELWGN